MSSRRYLLTTDVAGVGGGGVVPELDCDNAEPGLSRDVPVVRPQ